jgi:hypothetical protein
MVKSNQKTLHYSHFCLTLQLDIFVHPMSIPGTNHPMCFPNPALGAWGSNVGVWASDRVTANSLQNLSRTTIVVPTPGVLSGISPDEGEQLALPQTDNQVAADILVALQQGQAGNMVCIRYGYRPRAAFFRGFIVESFKRIFIARLKLI